MKNREKHLELESGNAPVRNPVFYSALARSVPDMIKIAAKDGTVKPSQALQWLGARQKEGKFKAEELHWVGLEDWLENQTGRVSVLDIEQFVTANGIQVHEVERKPVNNESFLNGEPDDAASSDDGIRVGTKYDKYTLAGGKNYREMVLTLPDFGPKFVPPVPLDVLPEGYDVSFDMIKPEGRQYSVIPPGQMHGRPYGGFEAGSPQEARNGALSILNSELDNIARDKHREELALNTFRTRHWEEGNVIAHIRFNERMDEDGKRVLFVEELQSDWGQLGLKKQFGGVMEISVSRSTDEDADEDTFDVFVGGAVIGYVHADDEDEALTKAKENWEGSELVKGVLPGPFVMDTKSWLTLGIKRMIRYAVEKDFDRVAFVNGTQATERFDLSKEIEQIRYIKRSNGKFDVWASDENGCALNNTLDKRNLTPDEITNFVGKDICEKIVAGKGWREDGDMVLSGLELKAGGEGMLKFYDEIVPQVVKSVLKKLGGEISASSFDVSARRLDDVSIERYNADGPFYAYNTKTRRYLSGPKESPAWTAEAKGDAAKFTSIAEADEMISVLIPRIETRQVGFDVTSKMRDVVSAGLPLFSVAHHPVVQESMDVIEPWLKSLIKNGAVVIHEDASAMPKLEDDIAHVQAVTSRNGVIHIAEKNARGNIHGVVLHEAFHSGVESLIGDKQWTKLMNRLDVIYRQCERASDESKVFFDAAMSRVSAARKAGSVAKGMEVEEFGAYAIEEYKKAPKSLHKWAEDAIGLMKAWTLKRFGVQVGDVSPSQLAGLAKLALFNARKPRSSLAIFSAWSAASLGSQHNKDDVRNPQGGEANQKSAATKALQFLDSVTSSRLKLRNG